ncbi:uncharacterized protein METZ01_LOCUS82086, partial [marine metagenome]
WLEYLLDTQEVSGSSPLPPTIKWATAHGPPIRS